MLAPGARYHVTARANRQEMIMDSPAMKELFLEVVARAKKRYKFHIDNFCVMGNHFHMIIRPVAQTSLSALMQWILSVFAMRWNRIRGLNGHVWGERFFSRIIRNLKDFMRVFSYIDDNPVKASQVSVARDWKHGGLWHRRQGIPDILGQTPLWIVTLFPQHFPPTLQ